MEDKRTDFEKVQKLAAGYGVQEQERQMLEAKLRQSPPTLMSFVDDLAKKEGVDIGGMQDRGVQSGGTNGKPKESSVEEPAGGNEGSSTASTTKPARKPEPHSALSVRMNRNCGTGWVAIPNPLETPELLYVATLTPRVTTSSPARSSSS